MGMGWGGQGSGRQTGGSGMMIPSALAGDTRMKATAKRMREKKANLVFMAFSPSIYRPKMSSI
jgi:hypothetical protein